MPKKQKNGFSMYMKHIREEARQNGITYNSYEDVSAAAAVTWQNMSEKQRAPFVKLAKEVKSFGSGREGEKYTSHGMALSDIERERTEFEVRNNNIIRTIQKTVVDAFANKTIGSYEFIFIAGNHFVKVDKVYLPAELAMIRFTLEKGIVNQYYTHINPGRVPIGYKYEALEFSRKNHQMPLPPEAMGIQSYEVILDATNAFLGDEKLLMFTTNENIPMILSFLHQFISESTGNNRKVDDYRVLPVNVLLFEIMKNVAERNVNVKSFESVYCAELCLDRGFLSNTACKFHNDKDLSQYCAVTKVYDWMTIFIENVSDHLHEMDKRPNSRIGRGGRINASLRTLNVTHETALDDMTDERPNSRIGRGGRINASLRTLNVTHETALFLSKRKHACMLSSGISTLLNPILDSRQNLRMTKISILFEPNISLCSQHTINSAFCFTNRSIGGNDSKISIAAVIDAQITIILRSNSVIAERMN